MRINGKIFFILLFLCGVGICAGSFFEVGLSSEIRETLSAALNSIFRSMSLSETDESTGGETAETFLSSFLPLVRSLVLPVILSFFSACLLFLLPLLPIYILLKGISVGFSAAVMLESFGLKGIWYILCTLMPQNLIQIPVCCLLCTLSLQLGRLFTAAFLPTLLPHFIRDSFPQLQSISQNRNLMKILRSSTHAYLAFYLLGGLFLAISCAIQAFLLPLVF